MIVLVVFLLVFFVLLLGMTAFEFGRYSLCCQQFQHCVDIAALGGATGLASAQNTNQAVAQAAAMGTAQWIMEQNYVLDKSLNGMVTFTSSSSAPPTPTVANRANISFTWLDPETGLPTGVPGNQKIFGIQGAYAYPPLVGSWIGLGPAALLRASANGNGGGTMLDVCLCFDLSGSIDDTTKISMVERTSNAVGSTQYRIAADDTLYNACGTGSLTGVSFNACYPQNCDLATPFGQFSINRRGRTQGQRAPFAAPLGGGTFTDVVVNLDENNTFGGGVYGGLPFPNVGTLVEAARGNLESIPIANAASVNYAALGVTPQTGYYRTYWEQALMRRHPLFDAQASAANFFQIVNNSTNAHFCLVCFASDENNTTNANAIARNPNQSIGGVNQHTFPMGVTNGNIPIGQTVQVPVPLVPLNKTAGALGSQFTQVQSYLPLAPTLPSTVVPQLTANNSTDINGALTLSLQQMLKPAQIGGGLDRMRTGATPAIIMFTDGLPTANTGIGDINGVSMTGVAASAGVKIYCIGLAQVPGLVGPMTAVLQPMATNTGGQFYIIPPGTGQAAALDRAFSDIARSLVSLTR